MRIKHLLLLLSFVTGIAIIEDKVIKADTMNSETISGSLKMVPNLEATQPVDPTNPDRPTHPVDPTNPEGPQAGSSGPLSIDFASSIDFGSNEISNKDMLYYANPQNIIFDDGSEKEVPNYVQITDNRGTNAGWRLQVRQERQLENNDAKYKILTGAEISFTKTHAASNQVGSQTPKTNSFVLIPGHTTDVMYAPSGSGGGTWLDVFGELKNIQVSNEMMLKNTSVTLSVPGVTPKEAVAYKSRLTWILIDAPKE